jgi:hypothetical protein
MSETRDEATGQFVSVDAPAEPLVGREGVEADQGYVPLPEIKESAQPDLTLEEAVADLAAAPEAPGTPESEIKSYGTFLDDLDPNISITLEQAAEITSNEKAAEAKALEEAANEKLRQEVDAKRGIEAEKAIPDELRPYLDAGLDRETAEAVAKPQVRAALEQEFNRVDQSVQAYTAGLDTARVHMAAALGEVVPHLMGLPPQQFEQGLAVLSEVDPPAFNQAMNILGRTHQIAQAQQAAQQQQAQIQHQQFVNHVQSEDARLVQMVGGEKTANEVNQAFITYLDDHNVPKDQRWDMVMSNPVLRTAEARQTIWEAQKYREMKKALPKAAHRALPPVQRPGTSNNSARSSDPSSKIASLERQLSTATGERAARISAEIHGIERKAANR